MFLWVFVYDGYTLVTSISPNPLLVARYYVSKEKIGVLEPETGLDVHPQICDVTLKGRLNSEKSIPKRIPPPALKP